MQVVDNLTTAPSDIDHQTVALGSDIPLCSQLFRYRKEFSHQRNMLIFQVVDRRDVGLGNEENVNQGLRLDIFEDEDLVIFIDDIGRLGLRDNLAKDTWHG